MWKKKLVLLLPDVHCTAAALVAVNTEDFHGSTRFCLEDLQGKQVVCVVTCTVVYIGLG
jgi:hypothetical protein